MMQSAVTWAAATSSTQQLPYEVSPRITHSLPLSAPRVVTTATESHNKWSGNCKATWGDPQDHVINSHPAMNGVTFLKDSLEVMKSRHLSIS